MATAARKRSSPRLCRVCGKPTAPTTARCWECEKKAIAARLPDVLPVPLSDDRFVATDAMPGTKGKVAVLRQRADAEWPLWHEGDAPGE